jgi:hypothetical protein
VGVRKYAVIYIKMNKTDYLITHSLGRLLGACEFAGLYGKEMGVDVLHEQLQKLAALSKEISADLEKNKQP